MAALFSDYEAVRKSGLFDPEYYLATYPDVAERNLDPLVHYLEEGAAEGRNPHPDFDSAFYLEQCRARGETPDNPLIHYLRVGAARGLKPRPAPGDGGPPPPPAAAVGSAAEPARRPPILVAIESLGVVGLPKDASRLSVSGWALAGAAIAELAVGMNGQVLGTAACGLPRRDVAQLYPDRAGAADSGFVLACDLPGGLSGVIEPLLTVRTADGETGQRRLRVEIPPQQVPVGIVDPLDPAAPGAGRLPMQIHVDRAGVDPSGILRIEGWVVCLVQIEAIEVRLDGTAIGKAEFGLARADIANAQPDYPNSRFSGFRLAADIGAGGAGRKTVTIRARARGGIHGGAAALVDVPQAAAPRPTRDRSFRYRCEESLLTPAGRIVLRGWAVAPSPIVALRVAFDGTEIGEAELGQDRPDIGNLFPRIAHARQPGFAFEANTGKLVVGQHQVTLHFVRADGETHDATIPVVAAAVQTPGATDGPVSSIDGARLLHLDVPRIIGGAVETPVRGNLVLAGWAIARAGVESIEIAIDGVSVTRAEYGLRRLDVATSFPAWEQALGSGFHALVPQRALAQGSHTVAVILTDKAGETESVEFRITSDDTFGELGPWSLRRKLAQAEIDLDRGILRRRGCEPAFTVILPVGNDASSLRQALITIASLEQQAYPDWRLLAVAPAAAARERLLAGCGAAAERIEIVPGLTAAGMPGAAPAAADHFFMLLMPGDQLGADALLELALAAARYRDSDFIYGDERRRNPGSGKVEAFFKPQWSPDLLLATNYIGRTWCARADLLGRIAEAAAPLLRHGEYDLVLRCTEAARVIRHVPTVLAERAADEPGAAQTGAAALARLLVRRGIDGKVQDGLVPGTWRVERALVRPGLVSIIIPTCAAQGRIETCIETLRRLTRYRDYEIVCIENIPDADRHWRQWLRRNADRVISTREPFNWSRFNNLAAAAARGEYLLFLNDDVEIVDPDWLHVLVGEAQRPEIGVVGPLLSYPDGRVQHAGMFLAALGQGRHAFRYAADGEPGYFGLALTQRNVIAVTGACLMTRRETFEVLGGFEEAHGIINNDVDYCLRAWQSGLANLYTPHTRLIHHEAVSRAALDDEYDVAAFDNKWRRVFVAGDPFFSPHLSKMHDHFTIDDEPTEQTVTGRPALEREAIRRILIVKLDHIGDCITAFPAVRRLKRYFPQARISVLTSHASRPVWAFEPAVEEVIEFDFFNPRSALGELERSAADWAELGERLAPERFDLAVDLRKHVETRPVLQRSGARWLAGFDQHGQFSWLDVALEWGGDHMSLRPRQWAGDDLVNLVDAIGAACEDDRAVIVLPPPRETARGQMIRVGGPAIWVHPTSGNDIKQWPVEYFAIVIDQLVERYGARIFLTGAPGDEAVAAAIVARLRHQQAVTSMIGKSPLAELPELMAGAALFLGSDSGLKHIAAGLGIPTVGVHGGTLDPREWGAVGPSAVMVARNMVCSPCYLARAEDCRRGVACLRYLEPGRVYEACERLLLLTEPARQAVAADGGKPAPASRPRKRSTVRKPASAAAASRGSPNAGIPAARARSR